MSETQQAGSALQVDQLRRMAEHFPNEPGYRVVGEGQLTFAEWERDSNRLARGLTSLGVRRGGRVAVQLDGTNGLRWVTTYAAAHKAGAAIVPLDARLSANEIGRMVAHAKVSVLVADGDRAANALGLVGRDGSPLRWVIDGTRAPTGAGSVDGVGDGDGDGGHMIGWDEALDSDGSRYQIDVGPDDLADILFTSGTTGNPKAVAIRHTNASAVPNGEPTWSGERWLHASPQSTFAGVSFVFSPMKMGMISTYLPKFDAEVWFDVVDAERPLAVFLVPAMVQLLLVHPRFETADLSMIQICSVGSAPLSPSAVDRLQAKMPDALVSNNYGMTEAGSVYCLMPKGEAVRRPGSVGKPLPPAEVRCIDEDGVEVPAGQLGRIELHIPGRPREYLDDPEATAATWVDGWLRTGDIGKLDEEGYLYISGRAKDVIIRGGHNIHAVDVENVVATHPDVAEVAVIGIPHEVLGEDLVAVVVLRPGADVDADGLRAHSLEELAAYKVPRRWEFTDHLPRNSAGKILKNQLRDGLADATSESA
jgi:acyl-CoA synthetase (AMP-forming)/AMP-acid ligase II